MVVKIKKTCTLLSSIINQSIDCVVRASSRKKIKNGFKHGGGGEANLWLEKNLSASGGARSIPHSGQSDTREARVQQRCHIGHFIDDLWKPSEQPSRALQRNKCIHCRGCGKDWAGCVTRHGNEQDYSSRPSHSNYTLWYYDGLKYGIISLTRWEEICTLIYTIAMPCGDDWELLMSGAVNYCLNWSANGSWRAEVKSLAHWWSTTPGNHCLVLFRWSRREVIYVDFLMKSILPENSHFKGLSSREYVH